MGQGEFTDRFGRKTVYQFNLLLFGLATIIGALPAIPSIGFDPGLGWLLTFRFLAGVGLGAEQPLCFSYTAEYAPARIRGRTIAFMQFLGGAWPWPVGVLLTLAFRETIGWRGIWIIIGILALIVFVMRFSLPESPRWLATHGQGQRALDLLQRMGLRSVPLNTLSTDAASDTHSDPIGIVFRNYPGRVFAGMFCFFAFFGVALGLGNWLPSILAKAHDFTISQVPELYTFWMTLAFPLRQRVYDVCAGIFRPQGRPPLSAFILAGAVRGRSGPIAGSTETMVLAMLFVMTFFIQLAGNSSQIFIAEVFPTNARASGFGCAQAAGRIGAAVAIPAILMDHERVRGPAVFIALAVMVAIAAIAVTQVGPEARGLALDEVAPPTA